ncbi:nucleoside 2-deoxyribosyltransferase [Rhizobium sp. SG2393]|uniref:nucleoside 2-deoxyribosyltransferase n=1 Tax=Rhizobium sp. SG2393 TaxID=3276279 RepID=UPI00366B73A6
MVRSIYMAGPEVFLPNARAIMEEKTRLAREAGFRAICPGDLDIPPAPTKKDFGLSISRVDEEMMLEADAIIANLTPFRGLAADVGTAFELGFMCALGKPVTAYTNVPESHYARTVAYYEGRVTRGEDGYIRGTDGLSLEDFEMIDNLMLHGGVERRGGLVAIGSAAPDALYTDLAAFRRCLAHLKDRFA